MMDEVLRQDDPIFNSVFHNLREGTIDDRSTYLLLKRCIDKLCVKEQEIFNRTANYLIPTWDLNRIITLKYLKMFNGHYAVIRLKYNSSNNQGHNHCIVERSYPSVSVLCMGVAVILLKNYVVEEKLMDVSMEKMIDIVYDDSKDIRLKNALPLYIVIYFQNTH